MNLKHCKSILLLVFALFFSCNNAPTVTSADFSKIIVGSWEYETMKVNIVPDDKSKEAQTLSVKGDEWIKTLRMLPIQMIFAKDGFYKSQYRKPDGSVMYALTGDWAVKGDSLTLVQDKPHAATFRYHLSQPDPDKINFNGVISWHNDGKENDIFEAKLKRLQN